jgi:hypothetical protein
VALHERVGHDGLDENLLYAGTPKTHLHEAARITPRRACWFARRGINWTN